MDMLAFRQKTAQWLREHAEEMIADVQAFSRIRSVSRADLAAEGAPFGPECRQMLDFALARAREMGFAVEDHAGYCGSAVYGDGENCIGIVAHLDVVPEGEQWTYPPYAGTREGDFLFGRGVSDDKSAAVMGLYLMRMFRELNLPLRHGLRVMMGCSEETGMEDMEYYAQNCKQPVVSLIPDSMFPANYAQKGSIKGLFAIDPGAEIVDFHGGEVFNMVPPSATALLKGVKPFAAGEGVSLSEENGLLRVRAEGTAAHAARPEGGVSAIHRLATALLAAGVLSGQSERAMRGVAALSGDIYGERAGIAREDEDTGRSTMVCGVARVENGQIALSVDCRLSIAADVEGDSRALQAYGRSLGFEAREFSTTGPVYIPKDGPVIQAAQRAYFEITGDPAQPFTSGGGTYSRVLENAVTFGPTFPGQRPRPEGLPASHGAAHSPDEFLYIPDFLRAAEIYALAICLLDEAVSKEGV
ncbi:MAG TPA: Sapep family Mn(2+)-dependent dipeptidase [Candidatus Pullichristensenella avicola]|nr:Sapep family Mn(2+)-dependent dipeptidase [Candidatus Pullichristensenella avicola]